MISGRKPMISIIIVRIETESGGRKSVSFRQLCMIVPENHARLPKAYDIQATFTSHHAGSPKEHSKSVQRAIDSVTGQPIVPDRPYTAISNRYSVSVTNDGGVRYDYNPGHRSASCADSCFIIRHDAVLDIYI